MPVVYEIDDAQNSQILIYPGNLKNNISPLVFNCTASSNSSKIPTLPSHAYFDRWLSMPNIFWVAPVPVLVGIAGWAFIRSLKAGHDSAPFLLTLLVFLLCFIGLGISIYPYVIPGAVTIWGAATKRSSQIFMLVAWRSSCR